MSPLQRLSLESPSHSPTGLWLCSGDPCGWLPGRGRNQWAAAWAVGADPPSSEPRMCAQSGRPTWVWAGSACAICHFLIPGSHFGADKLFFSSLSSPLMRLISSALQLTNTSSLTKRRFPPKCFPVAKLNINDLPLWPGYSWDPMSPHRRVRGQHWSYENVVIVSCPPILEHVDRLWLPGDRGSACHWVRPSCARCVGCCPR